MSGHAQLVGDPGVDPDLLKQRLYLICHGNAMGSLKRSWKTLLGRGVHNLSLAMLTTPILQ